MSAVFSFLHRIFISKAKLIFVNLIILFILFEISSRFYLSLRRESDFVDPSSVAEFYFPELKPSKQNPPAPKKHNILLLGASVLNPTWGSVEEEIKKALNESIPGAFTIHNMGMPSHTSRDSLIKYNLLEAYTFDKIFVYHGINVIRMNNYSRERYKSDYSHIHWYRIVNPFIKHTELPFIATPFMIQHTWFKITTRNNDEEFENKEYGNEIKTGKALASNLKTIAEIAKERGEDLIFATFATHLPANYSEEDFNAKKLDYAKHSLPVEV